ncbi:MAG: PKD domain-containing protein [Nocardioidaceae bacterium]|nr:MAG: PKD domain-containing protein [Nocardioidaceae bacterium]
MPAVFFQPGYGMFYIRPLRPDPQDVNVNDYLAGVENGPLHVYLHTSGEPLSPTIAVDRATAEVGQSSAFTVLFDPEATGNLEYNWNFGDGATSNKPAPQHPWTAAGTYRVYLNVARTGQLPSQSNILEITVKPKKVKPDPEPKDPKPTKGPTKGGKGDKHNPETGPDDSKGEHGDGTPSTDDDQDRGRAGSREPRPAPVLRRVPRQTPIQRTRTAKAR